MQNKKKNPNSKYKIGFTCGAFDLCHAGHMLMFKDCKQVCDYLIVGLHIDPTLNIEYRLETKNQLKNKPIMSPEERKIILEGIKYVDEVVTYSTEEDLLALLKNLRYDVRILGSDWEGKKYTGWDLPHVPYFHHRDHNFSTSELRKRIYEAEFKRLYPLASSLAELAKMAEAAEIPVTSSRHKESAVSHGVVAASLPATSYRPRRVSRAVKVTRDAHARSRA